MSSAPEPSASLTNRILSQDRGDHFDRWIELLSAIVLSLATILTAWCGYQATRWSGEQAENYSLAATYRIQESQLTNQMLLRRSTHVGLFVQYAAAISENNQLLADFMLKRFPPELRTATDAWIATQPLKNPDAPGTPFDMNEYVLPETAQAAHAKELADTTFAQATLANDISDRYVLYTVVFAGVLFLGGISGKFQWRVIDAVMLSVAAIVFIIAFILLLGSPVH